jgi:hypothetical protein
MKSIKLVALLSALVAGLGLQSNAQVIYVSNYHDNNAVGTYTLSGQTINPQFIGFVWGNPVGMAQMGSDLLVSYGFGRVAEFSSSGATLNNSFITGLGINPFGMVVSGSSLFIASESQIGLYTTSGQTVNSSLVSFSGAAGLALSGNNLFVSSWEGTGNIGEFTTAGTPVNSSLVTGLDNPLGLAISGNDLFVANSGSGTIGEYTLSGQTVNASLITGLADPQGLAILGNDLFVTEPGNNTVGEFTLSGQAVNADLISGLDSPVGIVIETPEPSSIALGLVCAVGFLIYRLMRRQAVA